MGSAAARTWSVLELALVHYNLHMNCTKPAFTNVPWKCCTLHCSICTAVALMVCCTLSCISMCVLNMRRTWSSSAATGWLTSWCSQEHSNSCLISVVISLRFLGFETRCTFIIQSHQQPHNSKWIPPFPHITVLRKQVSCLMSPSSHSVTTLLFILCDTAFLLHYVASSRRISCG